MLNGHMFIVAIIPRSYECLNSLYICICLVGEELALKTVDELMLLVDANRCDLKVKSISHSAMSGSL